MIVIVGGGYAGAATAWALARRGLGPRVVLLEAEQSVGLHASGRNAGLICPLLEQDIPMLEMAMRGAGLLASSLGMSTCGSIRLVRDEARAAELKIQASNLRVPVRVQRTMELSREIPLLTGAISPWAVQVSNDGTVDPGTLVRRYLDEASETGARVITGARVTAVSVRHGRVATVETTAGSFDVEWLVNAAGAWAGGLGEMAGLTGLGLIAYRRHLFHTTSLPDLPAGMPFVWDLEEDLYFRADAGRLMLCCCDEEPHPAGAPEVSPAVATLLAQKIGMTFPALAAFRVDQQRACLRTFAPDRRYVVGADPRLKGFFWVAGLGGSGALAGPAIGELAADLMLEREPATCSAASARAFDPARLFTPGAGATAE